MYCEACALLTSVGRTLYGVSMLVMEFFRSLELRDHCGQNVEEKLKNCNNQMPCPRANPLHAYALPNRKS
jgi:hypothetical protein